MLCQLNSACQQYHPFLTSYWYVCHCFSSFRLHCVQFQWRSLMQRNLSRFGFFVMASPKWKFWQRRLSCLFKLLCLRYANKTVNPLPVFNPFNSKKAVFFETSYYSWKGHQCSCTQLLWAFLICPFCQHFHWKETKVPGKACSLTNYLQYL